MSPDDFIAKWQGVALTERSSAQEHFIDLCRMLDEKTSIETSNRTASTWLGRHHEILARTLVRNVAATCRRVSDGRLSSPFRGRAPLMAWQSP